MKSIYLKLFNYLSYKYLVEKEACNIQSKYNIFNNKEDGGYVDIKKISQEEILLKLYVVYIWFFLIRERILILN